MAAALDRGTPAGVLTMDRMKLSFFSLLASAFVLAGLLVVRMPRVLPTAQATMVDDQDRFSLMTAITRTNQESLFVIDQANEKLLVYDMNPAGAGPNTVGVLDFQTALDLRTAFNTGGGGGGYQMH
jgi:hypothetical protein